MAYSENTQTRLRTALGQLRSARTATHALARRLLAASPVRIPGWVRSALPCRICGAGWWVFIEQKTNLSGTPDEIYACNACHVLVNLSTLRADLTLQKTSSEEFYRLSAADIERLPQIVEDHKGLLASLIPRQWTSVSDKVFLDFGAGRGILPIAARILGFRRGIGVDLNTQQFRTIIQHVAAGRDAEMYESMDDLDVQADLCAMWHTLEHLVDPVALLRALHRHIRPGGRLALQVPQYRREYVCDTHYYFFTRPSLEALLVRAGFTVEEISFDLVNEFTTAYAVASAPVSEAEDSLLLKGVGSVLTQLRRFVS